MTGKLNRSGVTLIELLVVLLILGLLAAFTLPLFRGNRESARVREATRLLAAQMAAAKAKAAHSRRPVGLLFERDRKLPNLCTTVYLVETPAPFAGTTSESRIRLVGGPQQAPTLSFELQGQPGTAPQNDSATQEILASILKGSAVTSKSNPDRSDAYFYVRLNYTGPWYRSVAEFQNGELAKARIQDTLSDCNARTGGCPRHVDVPLPFQILLPPVRSHADVLQLPAGVGIDLWYSGFDTWGREFQSGNDDLTPLVMLFSPEGRIERLEPTDEPSHGHAHLLVGYAEKVVVDQPDEAQRWMNLNINNGSAFWVSVNIFSGKITSAENGARKHVTDTIMIDTPYPGQNPIRWFNYMLESRRFAVAGSDATGL